MPLHLTKNTLWYIIAAILALHMLNVPFAVVPWLTDKGPTWLGLDVSWQMTLNYANIKNWVFGKDIIYTYGPLVYFSTRYGWGVPLWVFLSFDLFVVINFFFVFKDFILTAVNKLLAAVILFGITLMLNTSYGTDISWVLMFFMYYWFYKSYKDPRFICFIFLCGLTVLSFYIKLNTGLIGFIFLIVHLVNLYVYKKIKAGKAILVLLMLAALFGASLLLFNISIPGYIKNAFEIIKGYNDIMYMDGGIKKLDWGVRILFFLLLLIYSSQAAILVKNKKYSMLFFSAISIAYVFLLKKQSTLRADVQHLSEFFNCAPLVLIYGNLLYGNLKFQKLVSVSTLSLISMALIINNNATWDVFHSRYTIISEYVKEVSQYNSIQYLHQPDKRYIPQRVLEKISNKPVDIFPWDSEYLLENKLNYTPRPVFQSFTAYTENLEKINYSFYENKAPEFVIYDYDEIDGRYPFNDECLVNLFLIKNYILADSFTSNERWRVLLQKKEKTVPVVLNRLKKEEVNINDEIPVTGFSFLKINIGYNLAGKIKSFWGKPSPINIMFMKPDGSWQTYKTSRELLKGGIFVDKLITSNPDFVSLLSSDDSLPPIKKIKLSVNTNHFSSKMKIECFNIQ